MSRRLNQTLLVGGVVYPAGTLEEEVKGTVKRDGVWDDADAVAEENGPAAVREVADSTHPGTVELRGFVEDLIEAHLADQDRPVAEVVAQIAEDFGYALGGDADAGEQGDGADEDEGDELAGAVPPSAVPYSERTLDELKSEAQSRDLEFVGSGANGNIVKADTSALIEVLEADDAAKA